MKLLKLLWALLGDDRLQLVLAGVIIATVLASIKKDDYSDAAVGLALAVVIGGLSWRDIGKAIRA
ncbi:hypothetical protein [Pseudomonas sp.]|uniref:hypothetical protein n=1 Tax=Pseudomonas sp. TaxID=306 RepID=UPI003FD8FAF3